MEYVMLMRVTYRSPGGDSDRNRPSRMIPEGGARMLHLPPHLYYRRIHSLCIAALVIGRVYVVSLVISLTERRVC